MLIQHTLRYLPAQLFSPLAQLLSMVLWTHWLAPAQMGIFTLVTVTQEIAYLLCLNWFSVYALRYLPAADDEAGRLRYLGTENAVVLASVLGGALIAALTAASVPSSTDWLLSTAAMAVYFVSRSAASHYAERARAQSAFLAYSILQMSGPVGGLAFGLAALQLLPGEAWVLLAAYAAAQAAGLAAALPMMGMRWALTSPDSQLLKSAVKFGAPLIGLGVLGWVAENYIRYLVQWREGAATLGLMIVGWALGRRCAAVASMLVTTAAFPLASRLLNEGRRGAALDQLRANAAMMIGVLVPVTVAIELLGGHLATLAVAVEYRQLTADLLGLSVFAGALRNLHMHVTDQLMVLDRRFGMVAKVDVVEIVACAVASLAGLLLLGIHGAVLGQALGSAITLLLSVHWARTRLGFVWPTVETVKVMLATSIMAVALLALRPPSTLSGLIAGIVVGAGTYGLSLSVMFWGDLRRLRATQRV